ncbi:MAG: 50S ribosomal protein L31e [Candidatus Bathyarchaeia archaeon]
MTKEDEKEKEPKTDEQSASEEPEELEETLEGAEPEEVPEEEQTKEAVEEKPEAEETRAPVEEEVPAAAEEEEKPSKKGKKEEEEEIVEERIYTVPLGKAWIMPANKRAPRAMRMLRAFMTKHMKLGARKETEAEEEEEPSRLIISNAVNIKVWSRGIEKPPRKIRVRAAKDKEGNVTVYLAEGD